MTSVSSLGSSIAQYQTILNPLDKNGDGVISADELLAAGQTSSTTNSGSAKSASSTSGDDSDSSTNVLQKITTDILSLMLSVQQSDGSDSDSSGDDSTQTDDAQGVQGVLSSLDKNGDGKLTQSEILDADPQTLAGDASGDSDPFLTNILKDLQAAQQAYQNTYGASPAANDVAADDVQSV